jgi:large subunit ribosomal protein L22
MQVTAKLNYLHISPRKVRAVINVVKGMSAKDAMAQLRNYPNMAARPLENLIKSAIANAEHNFSILPETLKIKIFKADGGPVFKRFRPGSKGRVSPIRKRTTHITLILEGDRGSHENKKEKPNEKNEIVSENKLRETYDHQKQEIKKDAFRQKPVQKKSGSGFVKRMFQRKSI